MTTVQEIEAAISKLQLTEIKDLRAWIDGFLEDQLELTDQVKAKLDQSRREFLECSDHTPELEAQLLEAADKPTTPLTKNDFAAIRERIRVKTSNA